MKGQRVVVTGLGAISSVGQSVASIWSALIEGQSGIGPITSFDTTGFSATIAGTVKDFDPSAWGMSTKDVRKMDVFIQYAMAAAQQAVEDAGLTAIDEAEAPRIGVSVGSGIGGINFIEQNTLTFAKSGARRISPFFIPGAIINLASGHIAIRYGFKGPNLAMATACTTGTHSIGMGARSIACGDADVMVVGGAEYASTPMGVGGFASMRALSTRNDDPTAASRPFDRDRDGFVLGDGAAVLVLESYERAKARGATIYAELTGFGMSGDAFHMTSPSEDGSGPAQAITMALNDAGLNPSDIDYINAHGTSTSLNDKFETMAIKLALGESVARALKVSSTKSMTGHLLGAAGALEAVISIMAMQNSIAPPTINQENPDPDCDLDYVPNQAQDLTINTCLSNSFGFGGTNGTLIFQRI